MEACCRGDVSELKEGRLARWNAGVCREEPADVKLGVDVKDLLG